MEIILYSENSENSENSNKQYACLMNFDEYGNLYIETGKKIYQINVSGKNIPYAETGLFTNLGVSNLPVKQFEIDNEDLLKKKIQDEDSDDSDIDPDNANPEINPEFDENELSDDNESIDEEQLKNYGTLHKKFIFWINGKKSNNQKYIFKRLNGDVMALYDTYIYHDELLYFASDSPYNDVIYRINIHTNGYVFFKPIGYQEKCYKLILNNNHDLIFCEID